MEERAGSLIMEKIYKRIVSFEYPNGKMFIVHLADKSEKQFILYRDAIYAWTFTLQPRNINACGLGERWDFPDDIVTHDKLY